MSLIPPAPVPEASRNASRLLDRSARSRLEIWPTARHLGTFGAMHERDRRRHRIYVTRNTEYHVRDGFCVAVRDRRTGEFLRGHMARGRRVQGGLRFVPGAIVPHVGEPEMGDCLYFSADGRDLVTSSLLEVGRPSRELTEAYPNATTYLVEDDGRSSFANAG